MPKPDDTPKRDPVVDHLHARVDRDLLDEVRHECVRRRITLAEATAEALSAWLPAVPPARRSDGHLREDRFDLAADAAKEAQS